MIFVNLFFVYNSHKTRVAISVGSEPTEIPRFFEMTNYKNQKKKLSSRKLMASSREAL